MPLGEGGRINSAAFGSCSLYTLLSSEDVQKRPDAAAQECNYPPIRVNEWWSGLGNIQAQGSRGKETSDKYGDLSFSVSVPQSHFLAGDFIFEP